MEEYKISVVIPIYNAENYLDKCLTSIIHQSYNNLEVILVDDGSTDSSLKLCKEWTKKDKRIKVFHQENAGVSAARNYGIKKCSGDYISFIDSDDYLELDMYEKMTNPLNKKKYDVLVCNYYVESNSQTILGITYKPTASWEVEMFDKGNVRGYLWNKLYARDILIGKNFDENIHMMEDLIFNYQLDRDKKVQYKYIDFPLYHYIIHDNSTTNNISPKKITSLDALIQIIELLEKRNKSTLATQEKISYIMKYHIYRILYEKEQIFNSQKQYYQTIEKKYQLDSQVKNSLTIKQKVKIIILSKCSILYKLKLYLKKR